MAGVLRGIAFGTLATSALVVLAGVAAGYGANASAPVERTTIRVPSSAGTPTRDCESAEELPEGQARPRPSGTFVLRYVFFAGQGTPRWYQGADLRSSSLSIGPRTRWVKVGLHVEAGHAVTLRVPASFQSAYGLAWVGRRDPVERFTPCLPDSSGRWTFFAGGLAYRRPVCAPVLVQVGGRSHVIRFGLGMNCPR